MRKKRVLLLSEGFGAGHTQAAHALSVGLRQAAPGIMTRVLELGAFQHPTIAPLIFSAYRMTVTSQPRLYGLVYRSQYNKSLNKVAQLALHRIFYAQTANIIRQLRPDLIVCTHPFPNVVVSRLKRSGLDIPLCTVITDYDAHGTWLSDEVDKYLVSTEGVKLKMLRHGVSASAIEVTGIPVHPNFWRPHNEQELRAEFGLNALPAVLVMGGGWGLVDDDGVIAHIAGWADRLQFIVCLGSNEKALAKLSADPRFAHPNIRLMGFTDKIDKLMDVSDLLITKPGGMTCTEGLAKGIPMLFYNALPGQEEENLHYFTANGFGELIRSTETIDRRFAQLLESRDEMRRRRGMQLQDIGRYNPQECSQAILRILNASGTLNEKAAR